MVAALEGYRKGTLTPNRSPMMREGLRERFQEKEGGNDDVGGGTMTMLLRKKKGE